MATLVVGDRGEIALPESVCDRYRLGPDTRVRIIETRNGILLVPLTGEPPAPELAHELAVWESLSAATWDAFSYEDQDDGSR